MENVDMSHGGATPLVGHQDLHGRNRSRFRETWKEVSTLALFAVMRRPYS